MKSHGIFAPLSLAPFQFHVVCIVIACTSYIKKCDIHYLWNGVHTCLRYLAPSYRYVSFGALTQTHRKKMSGWYLFCDHCAVQYVSDLSRYLSCAKLINKQNSSQSVGNMPPTPLSTSTVKPVYNDHLMGYFSAFWSSSRWPRDT